MPDAAAAAAQHHQYGMAYVVVSNGITGCRQPQKHIDRLSVRQVSEGLDTLKAIGGAFTDARHKPLQNIRIWHTVALEDPFPDPPGLEALVPEASPERAASQVPTLSVLCLI